MAGSNHSHIVRFAPSPNGYLHLGHAYSALLNAAVAEHIGASFLVRIEDIDLGRRRDDYVTAIFEDLDWLGLEWAAPVRQQSDHFDDYAKAIAQLKQQGLLYPCFCTRKQIVAAWGDDDVPTDPDGAPLYKGTCKKLSEAARTEKMASGETPCWRLDVAKALEQVETPLYWRELSDWRGDETTEVEAKPEAFGDVVFVRKDVPTSYHLAVVMDDALQDVSHIVRGKDLYHATAIHRLLQALLGFKSPTYFHHELLLDEQGQKLAKSKGSMAIKDYRQQGGTLEALKADLRAQGLL